MVSKTLILAVVLLVSSNVEACTDGHADKKDRKGPYHACCTTTDDCESGFQCHQPPPYRGKTYDAFCVCTGGYSVGRKEQGPHNACCRYHEDCQSKHCDEDLFVCS
ncbi:MAG: hypothetical protein J3Q66DRAFT_369858 [Benniella sp.]|nr:MAG: hypothetical protein J3Q66DRAFT_369858 [Benniella sp.]